MLLGELLRHGHYLGVILKHHAGYLSQRLSAFD